MILSKSIRDWFKSRKTVSCKLPILLQSVAPSRANSRMQQYEDGGGAVANDGPATPDGAAEERDASTPTPRGDKPTNQRSAAADDAANGVAPDSEDDADAGYWRRADASRPPSPPMPDNASDASSMMPPARPKSRAQEATASRYSNLSYWKARRVVFYKNGDPFFPGVEFRFKPGRDIVSLESLLDKLSLRMDLPRGARYIFSMDGDRKYRLDELEDGASYVVSSYKAFKVSSTLKLVPRGLF